MKRVYGSRIRLVFLFAGCVVAGCTGGGGANNDASTGALTAAGSIAAGTNPESVTVDPTGRFAYVANSGGTVSEFTINPSTGALTAAGSIAAGTGTVSVITTGKIQ